MARGRGGSAWSAVIAGATVVRMTEQKEPMLVEVPCDPDQFVDKSEIDTTVCYGGGELREEFSRRSSR
jgi:hypothetical protein